MKSLLLVVLLSGALPAPAADPAPSPNFFELTARWAARPVAELEADAARGDAVAQFYLGKLFLAGRGLPRDVARGLALLKQSVAQGNSEAMAELGECHFLGGGLPQNFDEALRLARGAAARSNAAGLHLLGMLHATGIGMPADAGAALKLYQQAAAVGSPVAMRTIGRAHLSGQHGFPPDAAEANRWYLRAAEAGYSKAMVAYGYSRLTGRGISVDQAEAVKWFLRAAALGDADGLRNLVGQAGVAPGVTLSGWRQAARMGDNGARYHLARLIAGGEAESQGPDEHPQRLLQVAAEGEHIEAALMLGDRYRWGYGGQRDLVAAARWLLSGGFRKRNTTVGFGDDPAEGSGIANWFDDEGNLKPRTTPEDRALAEAIRLYLRALRQRDAEAMRELAGWYQRGRLVPVDLVEATAWLQLAATTGSPTANQERDALESKLPADQRNQGRVRSLQLLIKF